MFLHDCAFANLVQYGPFSNSTLSSAKFVDPSKLVFYQIPSCVALAVDECLCTAISAIKTAQHARRPILPGIHLSTARPFHTSSLSSQVYHIACPNLLNKPEFSQPPLSYYPSHPPKLSSPSSSLFCQSKWAKQALTATKVLS